MDKLNTSFWKLRHGNKKRRKIINLSSKPSLRKNKIFIHSKNENYKTQKKIKETDYPNSTAEACKQWDICF